MCLITPARRGPQVVIDYDDYDAPRPVSNYHGGRSPRRSAERVYYRRRSGSIPRELVSYRSSYRVDEPRISRISADYSEGYVRRNIGRSHSIRSKKSDADKSVPKHRFAMASLRGMQQPELSKKLYKLIKTENHAISAYESASREGQSIANQLSEWGESTEDDAVSDISDKLGVLLSEIAEQEDLYSQNLEESRGILKQIRNTESSVHPSRTHKAKIQDEIQKLKYKEPESTKIVTLEQELVRAEAQSLVAEAQLTNVTRQKFKEAFDVHTAAVIERAEKQIILAQQARVLLSLLDDSPIIPGEERQPFAQTEAAREVLNEAEAHLKSWTPSVQPIPTSAGKIGSNAMPDASAAATEQQLPIHAAEQKLVSEGHVEHPQQTTAAPTTTHVIAPSEPPYPTTETTGAVAS